MKITRLFSVYPLGAGMDLSSVPGTQPPAALKVARNCYSGPRRSLRKRPGQTRIPYIGSDDGTQAACHFFGTVGQGQFQEVVRIRKGKVEVIRDISGSEPQLVILQQQASDGTLSDFTVSDSDTVTFERFGNALIFMFENTAPKYYTIGGNLKPLGILSGQTTTPPTIYRTFQFRGWYSGRKAAPHTVYMSAANDINDYSIFGGGGSYRVNDGDGDPVGVTALSSPFRSAMWITKWQNLYKMALGGYGYGWEQVSDEIGAVHHNAVAANRIDLIMVDSSGIQSLQRILSTPGPPEEIALTSKIYEYFQENVNWSNAKNMVLVYDRSTGGFMLSFAKGGSGVNNTVLFMNAHGEFFEWTDIEYPSIAKYYDFGRTRMMVADNDEGISVLDSKVNTKNGKPISTYFETDLIFPMGNPKFSMGFTQAWLLTKPSLKSNPVTLGYAFDGRAGVYQTLDLAGSGFGSKIALNSLGDGGLIGTDLIGKMDTDMAVIPFKFEGEGFGVRFSLDHSPTDENADQELEVYGILYEASYEEDSDAKRTA